MQRAAQDAQAHPGRSLDEGVFSSGRWFKEPYEDTKAHLPFGAALMDRMPDIEAIHSIW